LVMEFMASWSEPSKLMNPIVANTIAPRVQRQGRLLYARRRRVQGYSLNTCKLLDPYVMQDLARSLRVGALPTFLLVKDYYVKARVVGVDKDELRSSIRLTLDATQQT
ncbi:hypothetical protein BAE44_0016140, partial [Dichanthelium oligosanthes]